MLNAIAFATFHNVASSKAIPEAMAARVASIVKEVIAEHYSWADGSPWPERKIAEAMGMKQPVLNAIRNANGALGVHALIALRNFTGRSIDDLLGLPPLQAIDSTAARAPSVAELDAIQEKVAEALTLFAAFQKQPGPYSKAGKALEAIRTMRGNAAGTKHLQEKAACAKGAGEQAVNPESKTDDHTPLHRKRA